MGIGNQKMVTGIFASHAPAHRQKNTSKIVESKIQKRKGKKSTIGENKIRKNSENINADGVIKTREKFRLHIVDTEKNIQKKPEQKKLWLMLFATESFKDNLAKFAAPRNGFMAIMRIIPNRSMLFGFVQSTIMSVQKKR